MLAGYAWDWFVDNSQQTSSQSMPGLEADLLNSSIVGRDLSPTSQAPAVVLSESGLASCLQAMKRHKSDCIEAVAPLLVHFGRNNFLECFTYHLRRHFTGESARLNFLTAVHDIATGLGGPSQLFNEAFIQSGALDDVVSQALRVADFDPQGGNSIKERIAALAFLADVWELKPECIESSPDVAQALLTVLKRGCRDRSRILRTVAFEQMFKLLHHFSLNRN